MDEVVKIINDIKTGNIKPIYFFMGEEPYYIDKLTEYIENNKRHEISLYHSFNLLTLLFFQFTHFFNQPVVVALDDVLEVCGSVINEQHIKQKPKHVTSRID